MSEQGFSQRGIGIIVRPFIENGVRADRIADFLQAAAPRGFHVYVEYNHTLMTRLGLKRPKSVTVTVVSHSATSTFVVSTDDVVTHKA